MDRSLMTVINQTDMLRNDGVEPNYLRSISFLCCPGFDG